MLDEAVLRKPSHEQRMIEYVFAQFLGGVFVRQLLIAITADQHELLFHIVQRLADKPVNMIRLDIDCQQIFSARLNTLLQLAGSGPGPIDAPIPATLFNAAAGHVSTARLVV
ncbi:MAG: hypothetical protein GY789_04665 [Hyphomicrobiales bacterium]|nr:hypothetical protein [Hyphomicrobiales bacterium]MCP5000049.1 hypothetical protein [Hyphomicrobiales bacterium]